MIVASGINIHTKMKFLNFDQVGTANKFAATIVDVIFSLFNVDEPIYSANFSYFILSVEKE